jgi:hypothetical protein
MKHYLRVMFAEEKINLSKTGRMKPGADWDRVFSCLGVSILHGENVEWANF